MCVPLLLRAIAEAAVLASALSLDALTAGFAYGSRDIKIPLRSVLIINLICSGILGVSLFAGARIAPVLPEGLTVGVAFALLFTIGLIKFLDSVTKSFIRRHAGLKKELKLSFFNVKMILSLYADPEKADMDASQSISPTEAAALALSLSLDGMAVGLGAGMADVSGLAVVLWSLVTDSAFLVLGRLAGRRAARRLPFNISWVSGVVLMGLAVSKLF
jgi:putative sporulation protein YtaF